MLKRVIYLVSRPVLIAYIIKILITESVLWVCASSNRNQIESRRKVSRTVETRCAASKGGTTLPRR